MISSPAAPGRGRTRTVLHLIETSGIGGAERVLLDLVRNLDARRWRSVVVVPDVGWLPDKLTDGGIEVVELREKRSFDVAFLSRLVGLARRVDADIVHSHMFGSAVRAGIVARMCGLPALGTIHGAVDFQPTERWRALKIAIVRNGLDELVSVSEPLRQAFLTSIGLGEGQTSVINNGVDPTQFTPGQCSSLRSELGISVDAFVVGSAGRLQPVKGFEVLIEAAAILKTVFSGYRFVILGNGDASYTRELVALRDQLNLSTEVVFAGFRSDVAEAMRAFDTYALTSRSEGFSLSTIEAMASGVPVVSTRCGGPEQILEHGVSGLLVENGSPQAVAEAIDRLRVDSSERTRLARAARAVVETRYTVQAQVRAYEELYERLLTARSSAKVAARPSMAL